MLIPLSASCSDSQNQSFSFSSDINHAWLSYKITEFIKLNSMFRDLQLLKKFLFVLQCFLGVPDLSFCAYGVPEVLTHVVNYLLIYSNKDLDSWLKQLKSRNRYKGPMDKDNGGGGWLNVGGGVGRAGEGHGGKMGTTVTEQ